MGPICSSCILPLSNLPDCYRRCLKGYLAPSRKRQRESQKEREKRISSAHTSRVEMSFELPEVYVNPPFSWGPPPKEMEVDGVQLSLYQKNDVVAPIEWLDGMAEKTRVVRQFETVKDESRLKALRNAHAKERRRGQDRRLIKRRPNARSRFPNKIKRNVTLLSDTVRISTDVRIIAEFPQTELAKMQNIQDVPTVSDISMHNRPPLYNNNMDKATCKTPIRLDEETPRRLEFVRQNTLKDETFRDILRNGTPVTHPIVVTTDEALAVIMTCSRSVHPWHLEFFRFNNIVFISKTDDSNIEMQWVGETADLSNRPTENDPVESERITALGVESTKANNSFVAQACTNKRYEMKCEKNPFPQTQPRLYRYRRYAMHSDSNDRYDLIVRCEIDAVQDDKYLRIFGLLEQRSEGVNNEWRKTLDSRVAKWISEEYRKNSQKMARWISLCHLSGALMKIGFLSRCRKTNGALDPTRHEVLGTQTKDPAPLAAQLGIKVSNMWAIADAIIMAFLKQQEFKDAVLVKRSGEQSILLIEKVEEDDDDEEEDDDEEDDDEE